MTPLFSKKDLYRLIFPLMAEQFLVLGVGMSATLMVSPFGEAAISGVSLVDTISQLLIQVFNALATGGAVICSQYLGRRRPDMACKVADQLLAVLVMASIFMMFLALFFHTAILRLIYGNLDADVMTNAIQYFIPCALSYPFLALYDGGAALARSMGNSKISMQVSLYMNLINVSLNCLLLYVFSMGTIGAGIATLACRIFAAFYIYWIIRNPHQEIHVSRIPVWRLNGTLVREITRIGVPAGLEGSMFQIGKVITISLVANLGTASIAANAATVPLASLETIPGIAMGLALITIVGQCVGAKRFEEAKKYIIWSMKFSIFAMFLICLILLVLNKPLLHLMNLSPEAESMAQTLLFWHSLIAFWLWPVSFVLPNAIRAAGDARFPMVISILSMWLCRIVLSYIFLNVFHFDVLGVWVAMFTDWLFRAVFFIWRIGSGKWLHYYQDVI